MTYSELVKNDASSAEMKEYLVSGNNVSVAIRIPDTLRDAAKEEAALRGMSFSALIRTCLIDELSNRK